MVSFKVTFQDSHLISLIVDRFQRRFPGADRLHVEMDLTATHANGCPLRLKDLLEADEEEFLHDIHGINFHLNRRTGKLENNFNPRFAQE